MIRILTAMAFLFTLSVHAGDMPCQGNDCDGSEPIPPPPPHEIMGFCDGNYEGFLAHQPGPLSLDVHSTGDNEEIEVTGRWNGHTWVGRGFCHQHAENQASIVFQFPNTPVQRGFVTVLRDGNVELDGRVDGGDSFRLLRH